MNFLQTVQRTYRECGLVSNVPTAVTGQTGMAAKCVDWVLSAHADLQGEHLWRFDWAQLSKVLSAGDDTYDPVADWGITAPVRKWVDAPQASYVYKTATGTTSRQWTHYLPWEQFRGLNLPAVSTSIPIYWTVNPQGYVVYFPAPLTGEWTAVHEYYRGAETLAANTDTPRMPTDYHMGIVWRAVKLYCGNDGAMELYKHADNELRIVMDKMERTELPQMLGAGAMV